MYAVNTFFLLSNFVKNGIKYRQKRAGIFTLALFYFRLCHITWLIFDGKIL